MFKSFVYKALAFVSILSLGLVLFELTKGGLLWVFGKNC